MVRYSQDRLFNFSNVNGHWDERHFDNEFVQLSNGLRYTSANSKSDPP